MNLFDPIRIKDVTFRNRIGVSPMCMYSYVDGYVNKFQELHLATRSIGGAGLIIAEATAIEKIGRITPWDAGLWQDDHIKPYANTVESIKKYGAVAGIQLAHAGRKASTNRPWDGGGSITVSDPNGWQPIGPSPVRFSDDSEIPMEMTLTDVRRVIEAFGEAAKRAYIAGFELVEVHAAHGYLLHSFYSPISNHRKDRYGGEFNNRIRFLLEVIEEIKGNWPGNLPLAVRISASDWLSGGWSIEDSVKLAVILKQNGVDLIDCSSGGISPFVKIPAAPGYQVQFAERIKKETGILTASVGIINEPKVADQIIKEGKSDLVLFGRKFLQDPYWPLKASIDLGAENLIPDQYSRGF